MVLVGPLGSTDIAKHVTASTSHVIAPLVLLDDEFACPALTILKILVEELYFVSFTLSSVLDQQAAFAVTPFAGVAFKAAFRCGLDDTFTAGFRAKFP